MKLEQHKYLIEYETDPKDFECKETHVKVTDLVPNKYSGDKVVVREYNGWAAEIFISMFLDFCIRNDYSDCKREK